MPATLRKKIVGLVLLAGALGGAIALLQERQGPPGPSPPAAPAEPSTTASGLPRELPLSPHFQRRTEQAAAFRQLRGMVDQLAGRPQPLNQLAAFLHEADEPRATLVVLEQSLRLDPANEPALGLTGVCEQRLGHMDRAADAYRRLVDLDPSSWNGYYHLGMVALRQRRFTEAETFLLAALQRKDDIFWPHRDLGILRLRQGRPAEALASFERSARLNPDSPAAQVHRMHALEALGETSRADEAYRAFLAQHTRGTTAEPVRLRRPLAGADAPAGGLRFLDRAPALGLDSLARGRGAAFEDLDGDGRVDLALGNLEESAQVWFAQAGGTFVDRATAVGLGTFESGYGLDLADLDNDGDLDLYVARGGFQNGRLGHDANLLFLNRGDGSFEERGAAAGVDDPGASFDSVLADFDRDGLVDVFVVNQKDSNRLYRNLGAARFADVTAAAGLEGSAASISALAGDFDDDGDPDLFVANNGDNNWFYRNDTVPGGPLRFHEMAFEARLGLSGGFGSTMADFDNDGDLDLFVANMNNWSGGDRMSPGDPSYLFLNEGGLRFREAALPSGISYVGGATSPVAADFDGDGWVDLYLGTGGPEPRREEPDLLYRNLGCTPGKSPCLPRFAEVTLAAGLAHAQLAGRGVSVGDYDGDGDLDLYVPNGTHVETTLRPNVLWQNQGAGHHWFGLRLVGQTSNRSALGARVSVEAGTLRRTEELHGSTGFGGHRRLELLFGLGAEARIDRLHVRWPSGQQTELGPLTVDRRVVLHEGAQEVSAP